MESIHVGIGVLQAFLQSFELGEGGLVAIFLGFLDGFFHFVHLVIVVLLEVLYLSLDGGYLRIKFLREFLDLIIGEGLHACDHVVHVQGPFFHLFLDGGPFFFFRIAECLVKLLVERGESRLDHLSQFDVGLFQIGDILVGGRYLVGVLLGA